MCGQESELKAVACCVNTHVPGLCCIDGVVLWYGEVHMVAFPVYLSS
jgi:hypothetical protein